MAEALMYAERFNAQSFEAPEYLNARKRVMSQRS